MTPVNPMNLSGRTVLVTGASSGIGRETAILLSRLGSRVVLVGRNPGRLEEVAGCLDGDGHIAEALDLADLGAIAGRLKSIADSAGRLDGLVHAAGVHAMVPLRALEPEDVDAVFRVNADAAFQLVRGFRQKGVAARPASVVLLASVAGLAGQAGVSAYAASKGAVIAFTRSAAMELAREGIRVNCVAPSLVRTPMAEKILQSLDDGQRSAVEGMHPLGLGQPGDVANAVAFLLADSGRWITGTTIVVDGGYLAH